MVFDSELPLFFQNDAISNYFISSINELFEIKNGNYFEMEGLEGFIEVADALEDSILGFVNVEKQKVIYFESLKKKYSENNERLRELNDQLVVVKLEKKNFGKKESKAAIDPELKAMIDKAKNL